jgi:ABC-type sugar transport system ATPase subunit
VMIISSDLNEILGVCDRIAVMCDGTISGILHRSEASTERIMELATSFN